MFILNFMQPFQFGDSVLANHFTDTRKYWASTWHKNCVKTTYCVKSQNFNRDDNMKNLSFFLLVFLFGSVTTSNATIIRNSVAGIENLEWLEFEYTQGLSRDDIEASILTPNTAIYDGYRYATREETALLLDSYYAFDLTDVDDGWRISTAWTANEFLNDFGYTYSFTPDKKNYNIESMEGKKIKTDFYEQATFMYGTAEAGGSLLGHIAMHSFNEKAKAGYFHQSLGTDQTFETPLYTSRSSFDPTIASLLVRDVQPVPEPATMLLFSTGIAGLIASRMRKKKQ